MYIQARMTTSRNSYRLNRIRDRSRQIKLDTKKPEARDLHIRLEYHTILTPITIKTLLRFPGICGRFESDLHPLMSKKHVSSKEFDRKIARRIIRDLWI